MKNRQPAKILAGSPEHHELTSPVGDGPLYLMVNLSTSCSFCCIKCALNGPGRKPGPPLTAAERARLIRLSRKVGMKTLVIIGNGEPTENFPIMRETIETAHGCGMNTIMFTTLNRLDPEQASFYASHGVSIFISMDSLDPLTYKLLTGKGELTRTLQNISLVRRVYGESRTHSAAGSRIVRLGVNVTVSAQNIHELAKMRDFCGEDLQFVANPPMRRGRLTKEKQWSQLVTEEIGYETLEETARTWSETGGHSSLAQGVCNYFLRGVSVDTDGEFLICGYAGETSNRLGNARHARSQDLILLNTRVRTTFDEYCQIIGRRPSCPIRDKELQTLVNLL